MCFLSDRIGVIYKGRIVELAEAEEFFLNPLHPYTKALLSAAPIPDPVLAKKLPAYDPSMHDCSEDKPSWVEIKPGHYFWGNQREIGQDQKVLKQEQPEEAVMQRRVPWLKTIGKVIRWNSMVRPMLQLSFYQALAGILVAVRWKLFLNSGFQHVDQHSPGQASSSA